MKFEKIVNKSLFLGVLGCFFTLFGEGGRAPDSIKGVKITPSTLFQLVPKAPHKLQADIDAWFSQANTPVMLDRLVSFSDGLDNWERDLALNNTLLRNAGYENLSRNGYSALIPGTDYLFKIAGQKDRLLSMLATKGIVLNPEQTTDDMLRVYVANNLSDSVPTYQTASRFAYYVLLKDRACKKHYRHIKVPESYLVSLPGKPHTIEDAHVVAVQKVVPEARMLIQYPAHAKELSKAVVAELYDAVVSIGLWNIHRNILFHAGDSVYVTCGVDLVGLSQPKNSSAKDFFHKNQERFDENVYLGLQGLLYVFKEDDQKIAYIKDRIKKDKRLRGSVYYDRIMELIK